MSLSSESVKEKRSNEQATKQFIERVVFNGNAAYKSCYSATFRNIGGKAIGECRKSAVKKGSHPK